MKIFSTVIVTFLTTAGIFTWFQNVGGAVPELAPVAEVAPIVLGNQEQAQIEAIESVAEAIVGVVSTTGGPGGFLGSFSTEGQASGSGSGIVYEVRDGDTYIVTNEHVINGATSIEVVFNNSEQIRKTAEIVGYDVYTDIAVLRIPDFEASVVAKFGQTEDLRLGQTVIAIGNPLGLDFAGSVTMGIVSGHDRQVPVPIVSTTTGQRQNWSMTVLQTDTAINPGNSGGALINLAGEVVGINSMKIAQSAVEGMSFSIPTYIALPIIADLEAYGEVTRPLLGVSLVSLGAVPRQVLEAIRLPEAVTTGVLVNEVVPGSLANTMGIAAGDVITHIGDTEVGDIHTFRQALFAYRIGDEISLSVIRDGESLEVGAVIE
ncbi:MAG: trypsin-like peptidase domain-containing protein [Turicibacter sp.]|nr:trypsin-like peptidase domain-containing protein [Turicibacter sp.]